MMARRREDPPEHYHRERSLESRLEVYYLVRECGGPGCSPISDQPRGGGDPSTPGWLVHACDVGKELAKLPAVHRAAVEGRWVNWLAECLARRRETVAVNRLGQLSLSLERAHGDRVTCRQLRSEVTQALAMQHGAADDYCKARARRCKCEALPEYDPAMAALRRALEGAAEVAEVMAASDEERRDAILTTALLIRRIREEIGGPSAQRLQSAAEVEA